VLGLLLALVAISSQPAATALPYHQIIYIVVSPVCETLRRTVAPVGFIAKKNDEAFAQVHAHTSKVGKEWIQDDATDRKMALTFLAHQDQTDVGIVYSNLSLAKTLLDQSAEEYPAKRYPQVAALRDRLRDVITMQQHYNSLIDGVSGSFLDNADAKRMYGGFDGRTPQGQARELLVIQQNANANRVLLGETPIDNAMVGGPEGDSSTPVIQRLNQLDKSGQPANAASIAAIVAGTKSAPEHESAALAVERFNTAKSPRAALLREEAALFGSVMRAAKLCSAVKSR